MKVSIISSLHFIKFINIIDAKFWAKIDPTYQYWKESFLKTVYVLAFLLKRNTIYKKLRFALQSKIR